MKKTLFKINKMDCPSEEQLIRMQLDKLNGIRDLKFDLERRELTIFHVNDVANIDLAIDNLKLDSSLVSTVEADEDVTTSHSGESRMLWIVLIINFSFFIVELTTGFISSSMGLVADSLDMLADAIVYGLSLYAVGKVVQTKHKVARISGCFQVTLAILGFLEVIRRFLGYEEIPEFKTMIIISVFALVGNGISLMLLQKSKSQEAHIKASMIFTSNDVLVNIGVILAGIAVFVTNSKYPDLIIGALVFIIVIRGAVRILKIAK